MDTKLSVGTVVELRSGGLYMTVTNVNAKTVDVAWFFAGDVKTAEFSPEALKVIRGAKQGC